MKSFVLRVDLRTGVPMLSLMQKLPKNARKPVWGPVPFDTAGRQAVEAAYEVSRETATRA